LLLRSLCLRRTNELLQLSKPVTRLYRLDLASVEDAAYAHVGEMYRQEIDRAASGQQPAEAYNGILQALLRLRLLCNHGTYENGPWEFGAASPSEPEEALELLRQSDNASCAYCSCDIAVIGKPNDPQSAQFTVCPHLLCSECLPQYEADVKSTRVGNKTQCPLCENVILGSFLASKEKRGRKLSACLAVPLASFGADCGYSTKLAALVQEIESQEESDKR
jgi:SWI/SNF-related matrix-associated actin-dependent regulator of chromatin subfamily A3